jgi:hypothetical protein
MKLPRHLSPKEKQRILRLSATYSWIGREILNTGPYLIIRFCVREDEVFDILKACHNDPCGGQFSSKKTTYKVLHLGYYWPTLFRYAKKCIKS